MQQEITAYLTAMSSEVGGLSCHGSICCRQEPHIQSPEIKITQNEKELVCRAGHRRSRTYDQL